MKYVFYKKIKYFFGKQVCYLSLSLHSKRLIIYKNTKETLKMLVFSIFMISHARTFDRHTTKLSQYIHIQCNRIFSFAPLSIMYNVLLFLRSYPLFMYVSLILRVGGKIRKVVYTKLPIRYNHIVYFLKLYPFF